MSSNNALLEFILHSAPGVQENMLDSKKDVDRRLKTVCEQFISDTSHIILASVTQFNSRVSTFISMRQDKQSAKLSSQPWADTNLVTSSVADTIRLIKQHVTIIFIIVYITTSTMLQVPAIQRKMQIYLANNETEFILFRPVNIEI